MSRTIERLECAKQLALLEQSNLELMLKHIHPYDLEALALATRLELGPSWSNSARI